MEKGLRVHSPVKSVCSSFPLRSGSCVPAFNKKKSFLRDSLYSSTHLHLRCLRKQTGIFIFVGALWIVSTALAAELLPLGQNNPQVLMWCCVQDRWASDREHMLEHLECKALLRLQRRTQNIWLINFHPLFTKCIAVYGWCLISFGYFLTHVSTKLQRISHVLVLIILLFFCLNWLRTPAELQRKESSRTKILLSYLTPNISQYFSLLADFSAEK